MRIDLDTQASIGFLIGALGLIEQLLAYQLFNVTPNDTYTYAFLGLAGGSIVLGGAAAKRKEGENGRDEG